VNEVTVYFRSPDLVITERLIRVRVPCGWQVWVIADLRDFGVVRRDPSADRRSWGLGGPALVLMFVAGRQGVWLLLAAVLVLAAAAAWYAADCRSARRRASSQLWASRRGAAVLVFERPAGEFDAACRALRRVLDHRADTD
jgi:hypothetical protein